MKSFYTQLSASQKKSISISMRFLIKEHMDAYEWNMEHFKTKDVLVNDLYFYWLRHSATRQYLWCEQANEYVFSTVFAREMKKKLRIIFAEVYAKHNST